MPSPPKKKNPAAPSPTQKGGAAAVSKVSQKMPAAKAADKEPLLAEHGAARSSGSPAAKSPSASPAAQRAGASPAAARSGDDGSSPVASSPAAPPPDKTTYLRAINWVYDLFECDFGHDGPSRNGETRSRSPCMCFCSLLVVLVFILVAMSAARLGIDGVQSAVSASSVFIVGLIDSETVASLRLWFLGGAGDDEETCPDGLIVPGPAVSPASTLITLSILFWLFYGVSIGADLFMEAIETITSAEILTQVSMPGGAQRPLTVRVWNATIANLTLMALGSSAPEILLSVIEIVGNDLYSGELGPSTIVGSAAFNLMVISAVCVTALPDGDSRYIKQQSVFVITSFFSVFAYLWLMLILVYVTPNVIDVWEGLTTLAFFPLLTGIAYLADVGKLGCGGGGGSSAGSSSDGGGGGGSGAAVVSPESTVLASGMGSRKVDVLGSAGAHSVQKHSAAYYRMNATRTATGGSTAAQRDELKLSRAKTYTDGLGPKAALLSRGSSLKGGLSVKDLTLLTGNGAAEPTTMELGSTHFSVRDTDSYAFVAIFRAGSHTATDSVEYTVATAADNAVAASGRVVFEPTQQSATLRVPVLTSDVHNALHGATPNHTALVISLASPSSGARLGAKTSCTVSVIGENDPGVLCLEASELHVREDSHVARLVLKREDGAHGAVSCTVHTKDGSAVAPADYETIEGLVVHFADGQTVQTVEVEIKSDHHFEGDEDFSVIFSDATGGATFAEECDGGPERAVAKVIIECDDAQDAAGCTYLLVKCGYNADLWHLVMLDWYHQFEDAVAFDGSCTLAYLLFYTLAVPWRLIFACAPPPRLAGGWACFLVALGMIGALTAFVGDYAGNLGCCLGISKSVTAITFVALGTSLPDTFASLSAARDEPHADNSLGNITGSNSVNVFLGLGLPWGIAAVYWALTASSNEAVWRARYAAEPWYSPDMPVGFAVPAGSLGYSVSVFSGCAVVTIAVLFLRRACLGAELGGPTGWARATSVFFVGLWLVYIVLSIIRDGAR